MSGSEDRFAIVERHRLRELVERYALAVDRFDPKAAADCFTASGELHLHLDPSRTEPTSVLVGQSQIVGSLQRLDRYHATHHTISSSHAEITGRDTATGETRCEAHHIDAAGDHVLFIHYLDAFECIDGEWLFSRRELRVRWTATLPVDAS